MSLRSAPARRLAAPVAGFAAALLLAGCGAGQKAQTYQEKAAAEATNDAIGTISVLNLAVAGPRQGTVLPEGSDAPVTVTLVNGGGDDDVLTSASTPAARSVDIVGPSPRLQVPRLSSADAAYSLRLRDLTRDLPTGTYIEMTLTFQRNGSKTMLVPVQVTPDGLPREDRHYKVAETDSAGKPIVEEEQPEQGTEAPTHQ